MYEIGKFSFDCNSRKLSFKSILGNCYPTILQAKSVIRTYMDDDEQYAIDNDLDFDGVIKVYFISDDGNDKDTLLCYVSENLCEGAAEILRDYAKKARICLMFI